MPANAYDPPLLGMERAEIFKDCKSTQYPTNTACLPKRIKI
jgi:hypothetical protein